MKKRKNYPLNQVIPFLCVVLAGLILLLGFLVARLTRPTQDLTPSFVVAVEEPVVQGRTMTEAELSQGDLVLVNGDYAYDPDNAPDLVTVYEQMNDAYFVKDIELSVSGHVMEQLNAWLQAFYDETQVGTVNVIAGHRTVEDQQSLYNNALENYGADYAASYFQLPGHSEHHTGLAVDFATYDPATGAIGEFTGEGDYAWLLENAWRCGFVQRYPTRKQDITGIAYESWHFRYVGVPHAWYMAEHDLVLEEYIDLLRSHPVSDPLTFTCDGADYAVYFCKGLQVIEPESGAYTVSGNNVDGFIVTVTLA